MRRNFFKSTLALASIVAAASMQVQAADGDIITVNGKQFVVITAGSKVRVQEGQGVAWMNAGGVTYGYVDDIASFGSTYNGYLDTSAATKNSAALTAITALKETVQITENIQARVAEVLDGQASGTRLAMGTSTPQQGMASGSHYSRTGVWLNPAYTHINDSNPATKFKGNLFTGSLGVDYKYSNCALAGLSFSYGHIGDGKTAANFGKYHHDSYSVSPYFAFRFNEIFGVDALAGYGRVNKKMERGNTYTVNNVVKLYNGNRIKGKTDSTRWFGGIFGTARKSIDRLNLALRVGYLHIHEKQKAFTESNRHREAAHTYKLGNVSARLRAGFRLSQNVEPFIQGGYNNFVDSTKISFATGPQVKHARNGYMVGGGLNLFSTDSRLKGGVEVAHDRNKQLKATTVSARIRCEM